MEYMGNIEFDEKLNDKKLVIYGVGLIGKKIYTYLENNDLDKNVVGFCVSDNEKIDYEKLYGKPVRKISEMQELNKDADFLIGGRYAYEMLKTLERYNISSIQLLFLD